MSADWSEPRGKGGVEGGREEVVGREGGVREDREQRGRTRTLPHGENERVAKKNTKGAKRGKRRIEVNLQRILETLLPTPERLQQLHLFLF